MMRPRKDAAALIKAQFKRDDKGPDIIEWHYGVMELRELMDFIYGGPPASDDELIERNKP